MGVLFALFLMASVLFVLGGFVSMSQATIGVGSVAIACYLAIVARILQASAHADRRGQRIVSNCVRVRMEPPLLVEFGRQVRHVEPLKAVGHVRSERQFPQQRRTTARRQYVIHVRQE